jgi:uncharacterized protein (DUF2141 family)
MVLSLLLCLFLMAPAEKGTLQLEIANVRDARGSIRVGLYNKADGFPDEDKVFWNQVLKASQKGTIILEIPDLVYGQYALAIYHDLNGNGRLDKNMVGVPTEPYGFSGAAKGKWSSPKFGEAAFSFQKDQHRLSITLRKWEEI